MEEEEEKGDGSNSSTWNSYMSTMHPNIKGCFHPGNDATVFHN